MCLPQGQDIRERGLFVGFVWPMQQSDNKPTGSRSQSVSFFVANGNSTTKWFQHKVQHLRQTEWEVDTQPDQKHRRKHIQQHGTTFPTGSQLTKSRESVRFYWDFESFRVAENRVAIYIVDTSGPKSEFGSMTQDTNYLKVLSAVNSVSRSIYTVHLQRYAWI